MASTNPLTGTVAIVTGGAAVAVFDIRPSAEIVDSERLHFFEVNIASEDSVEAGVKELISKWGSLNVLINNAGVMDQMCSHSLVKTADTTTDSWNLCLAVNVTGPFIMSRFAIHQFLKQGTRGNIVNVCSAASIRGSAAGAAYTASKHALLGLSRSTAWGHAKDGIRCNAILLGGEQTSVSQDMKMEGPGHLSLARFMSTMPNVCEPRDIAEVVLFLATAKGVNGAEVAVDHGRKTS